MTTITQFAKLIEDDLATTILQIETAMSRDGVDYDTRANLRGQLLATKAFADTHMGHVLRNECVSGEWVELYHRLSLAAMGERQRYEGFCEDEIDITQRTRFSGSAQAEGFIEGLLDNRKAGTELVDKANPICSECATCTGCKKQCRKCGWQADSESELDAVGWCTECAADARDVEGGGDRRALLVASPGSGLFVQRRGVLWPWVTMVLSRIVPPWRAGGREVPVASAKKYVRARGLCGIYTTR